MGKVQFYDVKTVRDELPGPYQFLTKDFNTDDPTLVDVPEWLMDILKNGVEEKEWEILFEKIAGLPDIEREEIDGLKARIDSLISTGKFLSGYNRKVV